MFATRKTTFLPADGAYVGFTGDLYSPTFVVSNGFEWLLKVLKRLRSEPLKATESRSKPLEAIRSHSKSHLKPLKEPLEAT